MLVRWLVSTIMVFGALGFLMPEVLLAEITASGSIRGISNPIWPHLWVDWSVGAEVHAVRKQPFVRVCSPF